MRFFAINYTIILIFFYIFPDILYAVAFFKYVYLYLLVGIIFSFFYCTAKKKAYFYPFYLLKMVHEMRNAKEGLFKNI